MAFEYYDYEVDPFDSDAPGYLHFQSNYYSGTDDDLTAPATANFPDSKTGETPTRYFLKTPYIIDVSDLTGTRPISLRDTTLGVDLTRVSASPGSGEYRIPTSTSEKRYVIELNAAQAGNTIDYDLYALGTVIIADKFNDIQVIEYVDSSGVETDIGLAKKIIEIGDWNMDITNSKTVTHGLSDHTKIKNIDVNILNDAGDSLRPLNWVISQSSNNVEGGISNINSSIIALVRHTGGLFDGTSYDSTSYNRGWVYITYEI